MDTPNDHSIEAVPLGSDWRLGRFPELMPRRVHKILLVSSAYDSYILEEDGLLTEMIFSEYTDLGLSHAPSVTRVDSGVEALRLLEATKYDLVITMLRVGNMDVFEFKRKVRALRPELPVIVLVSHVPDLTRLGERRHELGADEIFVWHGDSKIFLAIIKAVEDRWNAEHDTRVGGVGVIILVEDSVRYRSSLLPIMYAELVKQARSVMQDGINRMQRQLRLRARPRILVAETFNAAIDLYNKYREHLFGVVSDVSYERDGKSDPSAGIELIRKIKGENPDLPCLLESSDPSNRWLAQGVNASFLYKRSTTLLQDVGDFMYRNFGFGPFIFRLPDQTEVARATDLPTMVAALEAAPAESVEYHARRNHFSIWLRARTEFELARRLRPLKVSEFRDAHELRDFLKVEFSEAWRLNRRGIVEDFSRTRFDAGTSFARIGGGSLGGKARGMAFFDAVLARRDMHEMFGGVRVFVPRSIVIGTDVFDRFLDENQLRNKALYSAPDDWIRTAFLNAELPYTVTADLATYLQAVRYPIAIRSSSLLEDSQYHPFAGVYATYMLPNNDHDDGVRLRQLCDAVKLVFASTYYTAARKYLESTPHRIEEQQMAVIIQQLVGNHHDHYFYPSFAGVLRSYNFYPFGQMKPEDGLACVALGLGKQVVEGGEALRFCPAHPQVLPQLGNGRQFINQSQRGFYAVDLSTTEINLHLEQDATVVRLTLEDAEKHGTLAPVGSVFSAEDNAFYDGIHRPGVRVVTFAHVLKSNIFPLAKIARQVLDLGRQGMGGPAEMEFAVNLQSNPKEFAILQIRPYGAAGDFEPVDLGEIERTRLLCHSTHSLGNGMFRDIADVVYVKPDTFDAAKTKEIAREVATMNEQLKAADRPYLLIGPGRWGSSDRWLGIPVNWGQISSAKVIVETTLDNFVVDPSQGSHFFHNLTTAGAAYLTINPRLSQGFIDWEWLAAQPAASETGFVRHLRLATPLEARIDGRSSSAAVLKSALVDTIDR
ncbi:MAG: PEP/pyruvate-binding domain-containing protein [Phycisphaerae bacterium]